MAKHLRLTRAAFESLAHRLAGQTPSGAPSAGRSYRFTCPNCMGRDLQLEAAVGEHHVELSCAGSCDRAELEAHLDLLGIDRNLVVPGPMRREPKMPEGLLRVSDIRTERLHWMWQGFLPIGKLVVLEGNPGVGKSTLTAELAACVSSGRALPGAAASTPAGVVLMSGEDGPGDTIKPRLLAAGADDSRVFLPQAALTIPTDIARLSEFIRATNARLVVIDPLNLYLSAGVNDWKDKDVRKALEPLSRMAQELGVTVIVVRHLRKNPTGHALSAGAGSVGIAAAARIVLLVGEHPEDPARRVLAVVKSNLAKRPPSQAFALEPLGADDSPRIRWEGDCSITAGDLVRSMTAPPTSASFDDAKRWLEERLTDGPASKATLVEEASTFGLHRRQVDRASQALGIVKRRRGFGPEAEYVWSLPDAGDPRWAAAHADHAYHVSDAGTHGTHGTHGGPAGSATGAGGA